MTTTPEAKGAPLARWQSLQWQFNIAMGALAQRKRTAPQAHWPETSGFIAPIIGPRAAPQLPRDASARLR